MNEQELNRKLAEWAGFHSVHFRDGETHGYDSQEKLHWLQFTQSLDACFKWLVPKVQAKIGNRKLIELVYDVVCYAINNKLGVALALCLAVEKLIDLEVKKNERILV